MPGIKELRRNTVARFNRNTVVSRAEIRHQRLHVRKRIHRRIAFFARTLCPPVFPHRLGFLDMCRVGKHGGAKTPGCRSRIYPSAEAVLGEQGQFAGMVNVRVRQENKVNLRRRDRDLAVFINVRSLLHAKVDQHLFPARLQQRTGTRNLMCGAKKSEFHRCTPFAFLKVPFPPILPAAVSRMALRGIPSPDALPDLSVSIILRLSRFVNTPSGSFRGPLRRMVQSQ